MGNIYRASSGTEGDFFMSHWCEECQRDRAYRESDNPHAEDGCDIIARTMVFDVEEEEYPTEWGYDQAGIPCCSAYTRIGTEIPKPRCAKTEDMFSS